MAVTQSSIEDVYGKRNVEAWADLDGDRDAVVIAARIAKSITVSLADLYSLFRGGRYKVPFEGTDEFVDYLWARMAGMWLYDNRTSSDFNPETGQPTDILAPHRVAVRRAIAEVRSGIRRLTLTLSAESLPGVVEIVDPHA